MNGRVQSVLGRFPAHFEATRPGKRLGGVVDALARDLDVLAAELAAVRRSHRLGHADTLADLFLLAGLHGLGAAEMALLLRRPRITHDGRPLITHDDLLAAVRARVARTAAIHAAGNGTVRALLAGAANALDLDLDGPIAHSADRFWHAAFTRDRLLAGPPPLPPEVIGLEENPTRRETTGRGGRSHGELFSVVRRGFTERNLEVRVYGGDRGTTVGPMLVNRDEGRGVGYLGTVGPGQVLLFTGDGKVTLDGADASGLAWSWSGACFASAGAATGKDFVFAGPGLSADEQSRVAAFAVAVPPAAFTATGEPAGPGGAVAVPGIGVGETRFAFFVREAHFAPPPPPAGDPPRGLPRPDAAVFDFSVFAPPDENGTDPPVAADLELSWIENEAYAVRVLIPARFSDLLDPAPPETVLHDVAVALRRFQPAGVEVRVEFQEKHWVLGDGLLTLTEADDPVSRIQPGMLLWPAPAAAS
jgi:hypothetical protein